MQGSLSGNFEELKWLQPGLSWSPDGEKIVLATKAGSSDALQIIDVKTKKAKKIPIALDGVFSAAWSPNGNDIAFAGNHNCSSDIYIYNFKSENFKKITSDIFPIHILHGMAMVRKLHLFLIVANMLMVGMMVELKIITTVKQIYT